MIAEIQRNDIKLLVVDPFVRCHAVRENDNDAIDTVMSQFSKIAMETECAVLLVHHTGKTAGRDIVGDPDAGRGASSLVWGARVASTLTVMSKNDAQKFCTKIVGTLPPKVCYNPNLG